jgi:hypothetical protein
MRSPSFHAPLAGALTALFLLFALALTLPARAQDAKPAQPGPCMCPGLDKPQSTRPKYADHSDIRTWLDESDEIAALEAIRVALSEVGDGATYVWHRTNGRLSGTVKPTASFKDVAGRVCRHIVLVLASGTHNGKVEGIACRLPDGRWQLDD